MNVLKATSHVRRFLATAAFISAALLAVNPVRADLGAADIEREKSLNFSSGKMHKAWCKKVGNNCRIKFKNGRMSVDNSKGIESNQVVSITERQVPQDAKNCGLICVYNQNAVDYEYSIKYTTTSDDTRSARILFSGDSNGWKFFRKDLEDWTGEPLRIVGPTVKLTQ